jgi:hypothetical protein
MPSVIAVLPLALFGVRVLCKMHWFLGFVFSLEPYCTTGASTGRFPRDAALSLLWTLQLSAGLGAAQAPRMTERGCSRTSFVFLPLVLPSLSLRAS